MLRSKAALMLMAGLVVALGTPPAAPAEVAKKGDLLVSFSGGISPRKLPRLGSAPVGVQMGGRIRTADRGVPPKLERITLEINRHGVLRAAGLPRCRLSRLKSISGAGARRVCRSARIGRGSVTSRISLPGQGAFASRGDLLAFNGRYRGRPAIFAHVASSPGSTLPLTYVIVFRVKRKRRGTFTTTLAAKVPPIASSYGYISAFNLFLRRTFRLHQRRHSFASAGCPAPSGVRSAVFALARARFSFGDGRRVASTLVRQCRVRGR